MSYKVAYIDEVDSDIRSFKRSVLLRANTKFEVIVIDNHSNDNKFVESTIKIFGKNGKAMLDISAEWINGSWVYNKINVRIKNPPENREVIPIIKSID